MKMHESTLIKLKIIYMSEATITQINANYTYDQLRYEIHQICDLPDVSNFTMKWIDDEGDPCTITTQLELDEAIRLYETNKDAEIMMHVFPSLPPSPGMPCQGEDIKVYRRGAKRWKKFYHFYGHKFSAKRFNKYAECFYCKDRIWGLGQQGLRCGTCRLLLHKRCQYHVKHKCGDDFNLPNYQSQIKSNMAIQRTVENGAGIENPGYYVESNIDYPVDGFAELGQMKDMKHDWRASDQYRISATARANNPSGNASRSGLLSLSSPPVDTEGGTGDRKGKIGLGDFNLLCVVGRGSYAKVFQVEYKPTKKIYAMKVIKKEFITDSDDIEWVQTEKHVFECASNHPFLVGLHSCFQTPSRLIYVIEFVNGGDLMYHMQRKLRMPEEHAKFYAAEIALALNFLHRRAIIYRDLKLDNVLMDNDGHLKLTDYGMCKEGIEGDIKATTFCGTPNYIAPEILRNEAYGASVDWWSLGVLMFEMLAGCSPWMQPGQGIPPEENTEDYLFNLILTKPIRIPRSISPKASSILKGLLNKDPIQRLACKPNSNFEDFQNHGFFRGLNWEDLVDKKIQPPFRPELSHDRDLTNFDPLFTDEPVMFTPDDKSKISKIDQSEFEGFEYINPLLLTTEEAV